MYYLVYVQVEGASWVWVVIFTPGQTSDYPSVCLPQGPPPTTTMVSTNIS